MKDIAGKIFEIYRPFKKPILVMFLFIAVFQAISLVSPVIYGEILDAIVLKQAFGRIMVFALLSLVLFIIQNVIQYVKEKFELKYFDFAVNRHVAKITLKTIFGFSIGQHNNEHSGIKQSIINRGEHSLTALAYTAAYEVMPMIVHTLLATFVMIYLSLSLGLVIAVSVFLFVAISIYANRAIRKDLETSQEMWNENGKIHSEILRNIEIVMLNAQEDRTAKEYDAHFCKLSDFSKQMWKKYCFLSMFRNFIPIAARFIVIAAGAYYVLNGKYSPGYLVVLMGWTSNIFGQLHSIGNLHRRCLDLYAAAKKYFAMLDIEPDIKVIKNSVRPSNFSGRIEFKNVSFAYPNRCYLEDDEVKSSDNGKSGNKALSSINFVIESGQKVAFVGHSGAGKSTIAYLLTRAYDPDEGQVIIDGNDLRVLDLRHYRKAIGITEQDVKLFDNTLRYNITFGLNGTRDSITDKDLEKIAELSCIDKFYHRLEKGFDTLIGEKGIKLSGGERQRVGIARALIKEPNFLIFDEATSNLDSENEKDIRQAIGNASKGKTTIIIAHRLSTVKDADKIFVMDNGKIVGSGDHDRLLQDCEAYQKLVANQIF